MLACYEQDCLFLVTKEKNPLNKGQNPLFTQAIQPTL